MAKPAPPPRKRQKVQSQVRKNNYPSTLPPEKRREFAVKAARSPKTRNGRRPGVPLNWDHHSWAVAQDAARKEARRIYKIMEIEGALPENPIARKAMMETLEMLTGEMSVKDRLAVARTLLEFNLAKPASTSNVNIKTAEDFLDELASKDADD